MDEDDHRKLRCLHEISRKLVVATFYNESLDVFWKRAWDEWMDAEPFPQTSDMEDGEYLIQCATRLQVLQRRVHWLIWRKYPIAIRKGELLPDWVEYPDPVTLVDLAEESVQAHGDTSDDIIIVEDASNDVIVIEDSESGGDSSSDGSSSDDDESEESSSQEESDEDTDMDVL
ncbi:hypothetical protein EST38_g14026 [Candolleomyces aberdarensis]|uniref:Uncharacterized protein n=1 Tax=Candolleomyces aberdarensis TaxID=2316362 RepID=A0A4Q2CZB2_9AGAR|nr:hypothetical protein EST38_g14026 [Candolleomyces aberdarensis]